MSPKGVGPPTTTENEQSAQILGEMAPIIELVEKPCLTVTLEEHRDIVKSMLGMNFDETEVGFSLDSGAFIGLQIPTNNLHDVLTSEMEELADYEDPQKDDQWWTDGFGEGDLPVNKLEDIGYSLIRSPTETAKAGYQPAGGASEKILAEGESSCTVADMEMLEASYAPEVEKTQDRVVNEVNESVTELTGDVLTTLFTSLAEGGSSVVHGELDAGETQEEDLVQEVEITMTLLELNINPPMMEKVGDDDSQDVMELEKGTCHLPFLYSSSHLSLYVFMC